MPYKCIDVSDRHRRTFLPAKKALWRESELNAYRYICYTINFLIQPVAASSIETARYERDLIPVPVSEAVGELLGQRVKGYQHYL